MTIAYLLNSDGDLYEGDFEGWEDPDTGRYYIEDEAGNFFGASRDGSYVVDEDGDAYELISEEQLDDAIAAEDEAETIAINERLAATEWTARYPAS